MKFTSLFLTKMVMATIFICWTGSSALYSQNKKTYFGFSTGVSGVNFGDHIKTVVLEGTGSFEVATRSLAESEPVISLNFLQIRPSGWAFKLGIYAKGLGAKKKFTIEGGGETGKEEISGTTSLWSIKAQVGPELLKSSKFILIPTFGISVTGGKQSTHEDIAKEYITAEHVLSNYGFGAIALDIQIGYSFEKLAVILSPGYDYRIKSKGHSKSKLSPNLTLGFYLKL